MNSSMTPGGAGVAPVRKAAPGAGAAGSGTSATPGGVLEPQAPGASGLLGASGQTPGSAKSGEGVVEPGTPPRVIGLDLSLSSTGLADCWCGMQLATIRTGPGDHLWDQHDRLTYIVDEIARRTVAGTNLGPVLAVVEGPSYSSQGAGTWDRAGLWWLTIAMLFANAVPVAVVPPAALKRYATGKGNATKPDMRMALYQRAGVDERDDNKVDAWFLAAMGLDHLGHPVVDVPKVHRDALTKVQWPEVAL